VKAGDRVLLGHGAGGRLTADLVRTLFLPAFDNPHLRSLGDAALLDELPAGRPAMTTDAFVVDPILFPGGDLGYLSVCGTVNDLAVAGARPLWLSWALILEEGFEVETLRAVTEGAARAAAEAGVAIVAGDTKVVPRGKGGGAFAVTAGVGVVPTGRASDDQAIRPGDLVVLSGPMGDHGATIMAARHGLAGQQLRSDVAPLAGLIEAVHANGVSARTMHDPTRGGVATTVFEMAARAGASIELIEEALPVRAAVAATCELLGLDPLYLACEGRAIMVVAAADEARLLEALRSHPQGQGAAVIGRVLPPAKGQVPVSLRTRIGGDRPLDLLSGMDLPRIC